MKFLMLIIVLISFQIAQASSVQLPLYYGQEFLIGYQDKTLKNEELKSKLFQILSGGHIKNEDGADTIVSSCEASNAQESAPDVPKVESVVPKAPCVEHRALSYEGARRKLFGKLHLKSLPDGIFAVTDVYCERTYTNADFGGTPSIGPDLLPNSGNIINTEHTWPQSRFTSRFPRDTQKSDLHHLFPTDSEMNARRGSLRFGNVAREMEKLKCPMNHIGQQAEGGTIFEVPDQQKGNTARAIFYFATRYQMQISPSEEKALRQWNVQDPVDEEEFTRNEEIEAIQGNRNPYIDFPDLVDRVDSFLNNSQN